MRMGANETFPDWILRITEEIWEGRGLGPRMKDYYGADCLVRTSMGFSRGEPAMTAATMATMNEMPDRQLLGEDVIWCEGPRGGMLSSHRNCSIGTHSGAGLFADAGTGRAVKFRAIADCWAEDGQITDEWLVRDNGAVLRQIGVEPSEWAARAVASGRRAFHPSMDEAGPYEGRGNDSEWGARYADLLTRIMAGELSVIPSDWDRACHCEYPGGVTAHGWADADRFWLPLRASFPDARFEVHHAMGLEEPTMPPRAAVRWSLTGPHSGWGAFGVPSGAEVHVMGISHVEFGPFRAGRHRPGEWSIRREWVLIDEAAIWMQIRAATG